MLDDLIAEAARAWPGVVVPAAEARRWVEERAGDAAPESLAVDDLYLCCACVRGDRRALEHFEQAYLSELDVVLERYGSGVADEAIQLVRVKLFSTPTLGDYRGRGDLRNWVKVTAVRTALELLRSGKPAVAVEEEMLGVAEQDVEFDYFRKENGEQLKAAIARAVSRLEVRERNVLRQHLIDRLNIDQIGKIYQVNRVTAYRWVQAAREKLIGMARAELASELGLAPDELESLLRAADSQMDMSLKRIL